MNAVFQIRNWQVNSGSRYVSGTANTHTSPSGLGDAFFQLCMSAVFAIINSLIFKRKVTQMKKVVAGVMMAAACACGAAQQETILVAADPFAVGLKKAVVQHLEKRGFAVKDYGATDANKDKPYFESAVEVCKALQKGEAKRAMLFCGTAGSIMSLALAMAGSLFRAASSFCIWA